MHTVIAGNGILALTTAFRLAQRAKPGDEITIIGRSSRPGSATLAAAAMLNSFAEVEAGGLQTELERYRFELSRLATQMWPTFIGEVMKVAGERFPSECPTCNGLCRGCYDKGTYVVNNTAADSLDDDNFDAIVSALAAFNEPHALVSPRDVPNYMPEQRHRATRAVYIPDEGWMNPRLVLGGLQAAVASCPFVRFEDDVVERLVGGASGIEAVALGSGRRVEGDVYLLCTGASAWEVLMRSELGIRMQRVFYGVGVSIEIKSHEFPHRNCIRTPNRGLACGVYSVPYRLGPSKPHDHIVIGASNFIATAPQMHGRLTSVESLMRGAMEQINANFYRAELIGVNIGWRPTSQDTQPLVGRTSISNLVIATGTKRDGFHLSPLLSEYVSAMLRGEPVDPRFDVFAPERPLIRELTREQAIEKAIRHQMSAAYQHGFTPAKSRMPEQLVEMHRTNLEQLHDRVGALTWGIPVEMLDMYRYGHATVPPER